MKTIDDYVAEVKPAKRRSRLDDYLPEILRLQGEGYSDQQIVEALWLAHQVKVTRQALGQFVRRRKRQGLAESPSVKTVVPGPSAPAKVETKPAVEAGSSVKIGKFEVKRSTPQFCEGDIHKRS